MFVKRLNLWQKIVSKLHKFANSYFYTPNLFEKILSITLIPLSLVYSLVIKLKKLTTKQISYEIPIINVGNLVLGGSGKTPLCIALYQEFSPKLKTFIILRGYKRASKGLFVVANDGEILQNVKISGDEAMVYAINGANVIVSEDRDLGIKKAINLGAKLLILDDAFSKFHIKKFEILLRPPLKPASNFTIPSGVYRYPKSFYKYANFIPKSGDIISKSEILNPTKNIVLVTAIANPSRLNDHLKHCIGHEFFPDHHSFTKKELYDILKKYKATSLLVTEKDFVKIKEFDIPLSKLILKTSISQNFKSEISAYLRKFYATI